jgi:hydrogenase maturation protein HypF
MLPYSPLHYLLIELFGAPLLATSANISGEPVLTHGQEVTLRLNKVADSFLHHNRHIQRPVDDSVYRIIQHKPRPLRLGRGIAPLELTLPFRLQEPLLAVGGHMKNTIALAWDDRIVISPHIGVLDTLRSQQVFEQTISDLQALYQVEAKQLVCDAHPGYASTRRAKASGMPVHQVYHHHAHAACLSGEFPKEEYWLVFCWDGVGLGTDGTLWGGEALLGNAGHWQRVASMQSFHLPGSEKVSREPWRSAAALCWEASYAWHSGQADAALLHQAWQKKVNCPLTTSVGRLFDAAAALCGLVTHSSHEAQGPMLLEALASHGQGHTMDLPLQQDTQGVWRTDWSPLLPMLTDNTINVSDRARCFHESLAQALLQQALLIREDRKDFAIGLGGGAFQNRLLTERVFQLLEANGFRCYLPEQVPVNDGGLCYGQVMEYHASQSETPQ